MSDKVFIRIVCSMWFLIPGCINLYVGHRALGDITDQQQGILFVCSGMILIAASLGTVVYVRVCERINEIEHPTSSAEDKG